MTLKLVLRQGDTILYAVYTAHYLYSNLRVHDCIAVRFGKEYWKLNPENVLPTNSTRQEWIQSKLLKKAVFNTE